MFVKIIFNRGDNIELADLKGIGPKSLKLLSKLDINSIEDLLTFYPFRYNFIKKSDIDNLEDGDKIVIDGVIETIPSIFHFKRRMDLMRFKLNNGFNIMNVVIYNRGFLKSKLSIGSNITIIGKYDKKHNSITASEIRFGLIKQDSIEPIYHTTYGISNNQIGLYIKEALNNNLTIKDYIPSAISDKYHFNSKINDIKIIHNPKNINELNRAIRRLKYEELFLFMLKMTYLKNNKNNKIGLNRNVNYKDVEKFINNLKFNLTKDQLKAVNDIYKDLIDIKRMNRLLQGDVGSGKTIVAIISLIANYTSYYQGALMAPTEILAHQHFINIKKLLPGLNVAFLKGKMKAKEKREEYQHI